MNYPALPAPMLLHAAFTEGLQDIRWQHLHGLRPHINGEVLHFLRNRLSQHILVEDRKYAQLASANAEPSFADDLG